jgi:hypothetical protein
MHFSIRGKVKKGLRIASGLNPDPEEKFGMKLNNTIHLQKPFFREAGVENIMEMYSGTINVDISPDKFKILKPDHEITCEWWEGLTETFWLAKAIIIHNEIEYDGYVYYPCPSKVKSHDDDIVEFLTYEIPELEYGDEIVAKVSIDKIQLI